VNDRRNWSHPRLDIWELCVLLSFERGNKCALRTAAQVRTDGDKAYQAYQVSQQVLQVYTHGTSDMEWTHPSSRNMLAMAPSRSSTMRSARFTTA
jgi:hypothetical protein